MTTLPPSAMRRNALRAAVRAHPDAVAALAGRSVSNLTLSDLVALASRLGIDAHAVMNGAAEASATALAPVDNDEAKAEAERAEAGETGETVDKVEAEVAAVRGLIVSGGFGALDQKLRELVTAANKPPVTVRVEVPIEVPVTIAPDGTTAPTPQARCTGQEATWRALFSVRGPLGSRTTKLWDGAHPDTPKVNTRYVWPQPETALALTQIARGRNVLLFGPAGTGKTEWSQQLAARTGRPFALISCDNATDGPTLVGMTVPNGDGVAWQDGQLTRAISTPGCIVCIDEPSVARPGALFAMQNVLANRMLFIAETGRRVKVAEGVVFIACDNTNGTGGGARRGYTDTNRLNAAFLDRFGVRVRFDFMPPDKERDIIVSYTGCTPELATLLVTAATTTRAAADGQQLTAGIGLRRLLSWAELLVDGIEAEAAFHAAVLHCAAEQDMETLRQQCLLAYDKRQVMAALDGRTLGAIVELDPVTNPSN